MPRFFALVMTVSDILTVGLYGSYQPLCIHFYSPQRYRKLQCGPMTNVIAALPNINSILHFTPAILLT